MKPLLVVAGEASGDLHGAEILRALKERRPGIRIVGVGGALMAPFLDRTIADVRDLGVVGYLEVIKHLPDLRRLFKQILAIAEEEDIGSALFIDYPGFNFRLAKALRKQRPWVTLHQYVCPTVWAWKAGRIPKFGHTLNTLYCLFDFEPPYFRRYPVEALWVGHPLVEVVKPEVDRFTFFRDLALDEAKPLVALLPGSRRGEVERLLPPMVELVRAWASKRPEMQWVLPVASTLDMDFLDRFIQGTAIRTVRERGYAARAHANAALVCSGTATLETALLGTPFAVLYKLNPITLQILKRLVKTPYFGLANIVAGRPIVTELLQGDVNPKRLGSELERLLDPDEAASMRVELADVRRHLGEPGAAGRVAEHLLRQRGLKT